MKTFAFAGGTGPLGSANVECRLLRSAVFGWPRAIARTAGSRRVIGREHGRLRPKRPLRSKKQWILMVGGGKKNEFLNTKNVKPAKLSKREKDDPRAFLRSLDVTYDIAEPTLP